MRKITTVKYFYSCIISLVLLLSSPCFVISQSSSDFIFDIRHLSVEDGLPDRFVYEVQQDNNGFIWMSTPSHICRYDGYQFKSYKNALFNISNGVFANFFSDQYNNLWCFENLEKIQTLCIFNTQSERVTAFDEYFKGQIPFKANQIKHILRQDTPSNIYIWIYLENGDFYYFDGIQFSKTVLNVKQTTEYTPQILMYNNHIWLIQNKKSILFKYSKTGKLIRKITIPDAFRSSLKIFNQKLHLIQSNPKSEGILQDNNKIYKIENDRLELVINTNGYQNSLLWTNQNTLEKDLLWLINSKKLFVYDQNYQKVFEYVIKSVISEQSYIHIHSISSDKQENLWIATTEGVYVITKKKNPFTSFLKGVSTRGIAVVGDTILVASYSGDKSINLASKDVSEGIFKSNTILGITESLDRSQLFVCDAPQHFYIFDKKSKQKRAFKSNYSTALYNAIETFKNKQVIISSDEGLLTIDTINDILIPFVTSSPLLNKTSIKNLYQNEEGIWIAASKGIFLMDEQGNILENKLGQNQLSNYSFLYIHEDQEGIFWLATSDNGVIEWSLTNGNLKTYNQNSGLFNENIYAIIEDQHNYLWLPSDYGLIRFDKKTKVSNTYLVRDGLPHVEFNSFSHFHDKINNEIFLGGLNGVIQFSPSDFLKDTTSNTPMRITSYKVLRNGNDQPKDLTSTLVQKNTITIQPSDNFFELRFALMDFIDSKQNKYAYQIEGYDKSWNYIEENFIRITSLPYGNYTLKIKGQGNKGQWSSNILSIKIISKPPFYWTWWFILMGISSIGIGIFLWLKWRTYNLQKDRERLEIEVQRRTAIIQEQTEALKALDKAKTRFFSNITHEFRTPLTLIIGPVEQMLKRTNTDWMERNLQLVQRNTQQLFDLINQLLDVSKMEAGKMSLILSSGDLNLFLKEVLETFHPLAINKNISLNYESEFNEFLTDFDKNKIQKIVNNLLSNAIKYTNNGGRVTLKFQTNHSGDIQIIVVDNGQGISTANQKMIFERFFQVDDSSTRQGEGTGIGLALVQELVMLMNGKIDLESALKMGSTFTITLPIQQKTSIITPSQYHSNHSPQKSDAFMILLIEDNTDMRGYIKSCLADSQHQILEAENGQIGLEIAYQEIPDLIISDVMMPIKNGFEVVRDIRSNIKTSHVPIILLTAKTALENRIKGFEMGADAYLNKPFNATELNARINNLIELRKELQAKYQSSEVHINPSEKETLQKEDAFIVELQNLTLSELQNSELNGDYLGHQLGMSRMQLHRKLKALTNQSVGEFIKIIRLNKAMELLKSSDKNVTETAYEVGFTSPSQLSRNFKAHFGISPSKVKK